MQLPNTQPSWPPMQPQPSLPRERRRYGAIAALLLSFFSGEFYRDVGRRWRGIGFWYLVLLMFLTAIPYAVKAHLEFPKFVKQDVQGVIATFPSIALKHGKVSSDPDPYLWIDPKTAEVLLYVDTTGAFDDVKGQNALVRLSDKQLIVEEGATETDVHDLSQMPDFSVDKVVLARWIDIAVPWAGSAVLAFMFIFPLIGHFFQVLIYGLIGLLFCLMFNTKLSYGALVRLAVVALTPAMLIGVALFLAGVDLPYSGWIYFGIEMAFLLLAVNSNAAGRSSPPGGFPVTYAQPLPPLSPPAPGGYGAPPPGYVPPGYVPAGYVPPGQYPPQLPR